MHSSILDSSESKGRAMQTSCSYIIQRIEWEQKSKIDSAKTKITTKNN